MMIGLTGRTRWITGALVGAGMMLGSVSAAEARSGYGRGYDRGGWSHHHRGRGDGFGFGDAVGIAALVGAVAIVASSVAKDKQSRAADAREYDGPPPSVKTEYGADVRGEARDEADFSDVADTASRDDAMADACAVAARDEAQGEAGGYAEVRHMDAPRATPDGYNIDGQVESRAAYRAATGVTRRFTCTMRDGQVAQVYLSRDVAAR
jgi:hypothetical protein